MLQISRQAHVQHPIALQVDGDMWRTAKLVDSVELPYIAPSLGGCESLIEQPTIVSYWDQVRGCVTCTSCATVCVCMSRGAVRSTMLAGDLKASDSAFRCAGARDAGQTRHQGQPPALLHWH